MTLEINVIKIDYKRTIERLLSASSIASIRPIVLVHNESIYGLLDIFWV